jgi:hypothetical protein
MTYFQRVQEIQRNFVAGFLDRESSLALFEELLHEYGLLPKEEVIDRTITNENFLALLSLALQHKDPKSARDPEISKDPKDLAIEKYEKYGKDLERIGNLMGINMKNPQYRISDSIMQNCPVCQAKVSGIYNRMVGADNQTVPVDPPRCKACMMKWIQEKFGSPEPKYVEPASVSVDISTVSPMDAAETDFFKDFEEQMKDFKL